MPYTPSSSWVTDLVLSAPFHICHCSPLGAVLKPSGHIRLILDLSQHRGTSVNDGILEEFCLVRYSIFDDAVHLARAVGVSAMMAKIDVKHAFRLCPVRMVDRRLLCFQWNHFYFEDTRLPFGCRTSPAIFNTFADALAWILISWGGIYYLVRYLDDFFMCAQDRATCSQWMATFNTIFYDIGVPIAIEKTVGLPPRSLTWELKLILLPSLFDYLRKNTPC